MSYITSNWQILLIYAFAILLGVVLAVLYRKNKITEENLVVLADYLDTLDEGDGIVPLLAQYAKKAVFAVEQLVKTGIIAKTNKGRKDMAKQIVKELASADGFEVTETSMTAVDSLIEAQIFEMKNT